MLLQRTGVLLQLEFLTICIWALNFGRISSFPLQNLEESSTNLVVELPISTTPQYSARLQPEYDGFNLTQYFRTPGQVKFQVRCFFYNGPCDLLAKWAKPRFPDAIFGTCANCTEMQRTYLDDAFMGLHDRLPELFKTAVAVVLENYGIQVPIEYRVRIAREFE